MRNATAFAADFLTCMSSPGLAALVNANLYLLYGLYLIQGILLAVTEDDEDTFTLWVQFKVFTWRVSCILLPGRFEPLHFGLFEEDVQEANRPWLATWTMVFGLPVMPIAAAWEHGYPILSWEPPPRACLVGLILLIDFWMLVVVFESINWEYIPAWEEWMEKRQDREDEREFQRLIEERM